jgi:V/A-type H+-transporting ATPase subunit I
MKRISLLGHESVLEQSIRLLQMAGVVEVVSREVDLERVAGLTPDRERIARLGTLIADAVFVRDLLGQFRPARGRFGGLVAEKTRVSRAEFERLEPGAEFEALYRECEYIAERLAGIRHDRARLQALVDDLALWTGLRLPIAEWDGTEHVALLAGTVPRPKSSGIRQAMQEAADLVSVVEAGQSAESEAWVVLVHRDAVEPVKSALAATEFEEARFPGLHDRPADERARAIETLARLETEERELRERASGLAEERYGYAVTLVQALLTRKEAAEVRERLVASERAFLVTGWVPARRIDALVAELAPVIDSVDITFEDPGPDDLVPVELDNPAPLRPFEVLTDLYGRPRYGEIDPTPLLAAFFFVFFGMTIGDFGYGLMLLGGAWLLKNRLDPSPGVRKFLDLIMLGGIATMLVGLATRSFFALPEEWLPGLLRYQPLIEPLGDLQLFMMISIALGVVQVSFGLALGAYRRIRAGDLAGALSGEITSLGLFAAVGFAIARPDLAAATLASALALTVVLKGRLLEAILVRRSPLAAVAGVGRGFLGLYGLVGYAADFLSYTRLAALGLAGVLVGDVVNRMAGLVAGVPFGIGLAGAALIMVGGHSFNVLINLLGGFVHSMRLQFIEFFGKFHEGTGRRFAPFAPHTKSVVVLSHVVGPNGGAS